jgi:uncharacterized protein (DUF305 family)
MKFRMLGVLATAAFAAAAAAQTQTPSPPPSMPMQSGQQMPMQHQQHGAPATAADSPATREYKAANARMHKDMAIRFRNDADRDFVAGMIPHHQGAIDMAKTVLKYGKDPEIRKLADEIIAAQEKEIAQMRAIVARLN